MKEREAEALGYSFTGMCWDTYFGGVKGDDYKKKAAAIKKLYEGADYIIVTGTANSWLGRDSKGIWGNAIFNKIEDYNEEREKAYIESYQARMDKAREEYEKKLAELAKQQAEAIAKYEEIQRLKKTKK